MGDQYPPLFYIGDLELSRIFYELAQTRLKSLWIEVSDFKWEWEI